jgi:FtsP/CotA-like multicopper oxidase with cupredoxin domain
MNRRQFLAGSIMTALGLSSCGGSDTTTSVTDNTGGNTGGNTDGNGGSTTNNNTGFENSFLIPEELMGNEVNGRIQYNLSLQKGVSNFLSNTNTPTWGINGNYLGPTLRLKNGSKVDINYRNNLDEDTTMHGHGMHLPAKMDGGVHQTIKAGATWTSAYTVKQQACTNWYHPHLMKKTAQHVMKGLAGLIIIDDDNSNALDLPKRYGIDDIPLIVQDRTFNSDGSFNYNPSQMDIMMGWKGNTFMVNGVIKPHIDLEAKQVRFRILNASNSRLYTFAFKSGKSFQQIATDNAFLETPVELTQLQLSPAERVEIVVDFSNDLGKEEIFTDKSSGKDLFKANINQTATTTTTLPNQLVTLNKLSPSNAVNTRAFTLSGRMGSFAINGQAMDMSVINETVPLNAIEIWEVTNTMGMAHNFHIHASHFQLIERNGSSNAVADNEKGFKDTVLIPPRESIKLLIKMTDYADASSPYMYHCHILEHEDAGMMGQFVVV